MLTHSLIGLGGLDVVPVYTGDFLISFVLKIKKYTNIPSETVQSEMLTLYFLWFVLGIRHGRILYATVSYRFVFYWQITELLKLNDAYNMPK